MCSVLCCVIKLTLLISHTKCKLIRQLALQFVTEQSDADLCVICSRIIQKYGPLHQLHSRRHISCPLLSSSTKPLQCLGSFRCYLYPYNHIRLSYHPWSVATIIFIHSTVKQASCEAPVFIVITYACKA